MLCCDHSNETSLVVLSHGAIHPVRSSNFSICVGNPIMLPFKWYLLSTTLARYGLLNNIFQHKIWIFGNLGSSRVKSGHSFGDAALQSSQQNSRIHIMDSIIFFFFFDQASSFLQTPKNSLSRFLAKETLYLTWRRRWKHKSDTILML